MRLPQEINLGNEAMHAQYARTSLDLGGKTFHPESLVYYAAVLEASVNKEKATAFVAWLSGNAQPIFRQYFYDPPAGASPLRA